MTITKAVVTYYEFHQRLQGIAYRRNEVEGKQRKHRLFLEIIIPQISGGQPAGDYREANSQPADDVLGRSAEAGAQEGEKG